MGRRVVRRMAVAITAVVAGLVSASAAMAAGSAIDFNRDIRPILSDNCFACHGPDASHRQGDLRLDDREAAIAAAAIVPGKAAESLLVDRIRSTDPDEVMPPPEARKVLSPAQQELLARWIDEGAAYRKHWAYEPPVRAAVSVGANAIDHLLSQQLAHSGLKPAPQADRRTLIRRLAFDLTGLPPTPEEVDAFVEDPSAGAYARVVERLLASPHFGERMAVGWLDVVRFADTIGYHSDNPRPIWPYRDYVIESFNENKPFDRFTIEQLAGDLLPDATHETRIGSAFNRLLLTTEEGGAQAKDYEARMLTDRVRAVGAVWLGQTTGCAACHDHKFDPITMRDFYSLGAFFADVEEPPIGRRGDGAVVAPPADVAKLADLDAALAAARERSHGVIPRLDAPEVLASIQQAVEAARKERDAFAATLPRCLITERRGEPKVVRILPRGNWMDESGDAVKPAFPAYLPAPVIEGRNPNRLDLARWLVSRDNPLTARVVMNRLWKQFFGVGLVRVLDDFGAQGDPPSHPELLDWLACEFMDSHWDVKHMVRTITASDAYKRSSAAAVEQVAADPTNRALARQSAWRLDAEFIRDVALSTSGLLVPTTGGPSVKPYQPDGYWENLNFPTRTYSADPGAKQYRRGVYTWWQRSFLHPSMLAFDAPSREECCADRSRSNIPQQALVLLNDPTYVEAARSLARRIITEGGDSPEQRVAWAWRRVLQRPPRTEELETVIPLYRRHRSAYESDRAAADALTTVGFDPAPAGYDTADLGAWTHVARVLLNLHETITRN